MPHAHAFRTVCGLRGGAPPVIESQGMTLGSNGVDPKDLPPLDAVLTDGIGQWRPSLLGRRLSVAKEGRTNCAFQAAGQSFGGCGVAGGDDAASAEAR